MSHNGGQSLIDLLVDLLARHPEGLRSDQIRSAFGREGLNFSIGEIAGTLRSLMEPGIVRFEKQRWIPVKARSKTSSVRPGPVLSKTKSHPTQSTIAPEKSVADYFINNKISAIPFKPVRVKADKTSEKVYVESGVLPTDWDLLRTLIPYYRECLRVEERPNMLVGAEKFGERFLALTTAGRWWPEEGETISLTLSERDLPSGFLKSLARRGDDEIFIGYPVSTIPTKDGQTLIQPIFTLNCLVEMKSGGVNISIPHQTPDINAGWLERFCRDHGEAQKFMNWIGIRGLEDDSQLDSPALHQFLDIGSAATRYRAFVGQDYCDRIVPEAPSTAIKIDLAKARSQNAIILFLSDLTRYSKGAIRELDKLSMWDAKDLESTCLSHFFISQTTDDHKNDAPVLNPIQLNEDQLNAVRDALNASLTVITGPPGTGKSQTVAAIMASVALAGGNALLASKNHKALDAIEERLDELTGDRSILARANRQWGSQKAFDLKASVNAIISRNAEPGSYDRHRSRIHSLSGLDVERWHLYENLALQEQIKRQLSDNHEQIATLKTKLGAKASDWAQEHKTDLSITSCPTNNSCLQRLPVVGIWLRRRQIGALVKAIESLDIPWAEIGLQPPNTKNAKSLLETIKSLKKCQKIHDEICDLERQIEALADGVDTLNRLMTINQQVMESAKNLFKDLPDVLDELSDIERQELVEFKGSVSVLNPKDASGVFQLQTRKLWSSALPVILRHFPLWAVTNLSAASRLPFQPAMFDYLIIDEASVCDIPSALPLLARAKKAVIVGDPAQLQHVTKISVDRERELLSRNDLLKHGIGRFTHRENSLYHLAASGSNASPHLLREHYRCHEEIADYFNQTFYGGRLRVLTNNNRLMAPHGVRPGVHWTDIRGAIVPAKSGCYAPNEIDAILLYLKDLLDKNNFKGSLGVVTAFREQATRLMDRISDEISTEKINEANLGAYTAHQFQGDARDVIVVSLCAGPDIPAGSLSFLSSTSNLMNVAVSRAKAVCHVFGNHDYAKMCGIPHIVALARSPEKSGQSETTISKFESPWEERLYNALLKRGIKSIPQYPLAGRRLDLAVIKDGFKLDIEVDGEAYHRSPDGFRKSSDLWRDHQIRSLGWQVKRFWVYRLRENVEACVDDIFKSLES